MPPLEKAARAVHTAMMDRDNASYESIARAVLTAIREPSVAMVVAIEPLVDMGWSDTMWTRAIDHILEGGE